LASLDSGSKIGALILIQSGMAAAYQNVSVQIEKSEDPKVTSAILIYLGLRMANSNDVNLDQCNKINRWLMKYLLGGVWQEFGSMGDGGSKPQGSAANSEDLGLDNYLQLGAIEQRMLGFVGTRQDTANQRSFEKMSSELKRYIPAYDALKFVVQLIYVDQSSAKILKKQRCTSRGK